jgi:uncharacterized pyridoxamine 5'-phosphate oxidase family protein
MAEELAALARTIIDANRYMTLATVDQDGRPRVSPVYFTPVDYTDFYWVSSPDAVHSRNLAVRPEVSMVVFDSQAPIGKAEAVYLTARAEQVPDRDVIERCAEVFPIRFPGVHAFRPEELQPPAALRLYRAMVSEHAVLVRGGDPVRGRGVDSRVTVTLS